jgi:hypothetical protein
MVHIYEDLSKQVDIYLLEKIKQLRIPSTWHKLRLSLDDTEDIQAIGYLEDGTERYKYNKKIIVAAELALLTHMYNFAKDYNQQHININTDTTKDLNTYTTYCYFIECLLDETNKSPLGHLDIIKNNVQATELIKTVITNSLKCFAQRLHNNIKSALSKHSYIINFAIDLYQNDPLFFIKRKNYNPHDVLLELYALFKVQNY